MKRADDWNAKAEWMREVGASEATFASDGALVSLKLTPVRPTSSDEMGEEVEAEEQRRLVKERKRLEEERRRIAFASSGGLVKRDDGHA